MKKFIYTSLLYILVSVAACTDKDVLERKEGVSLPAVTNLTLEQVDDTLVKLAWEIPATIPESIEQPLNVFIEVKEKIGPTRTVSVFNTIVPNAPTEFLYQIPDSSKTYHLTVKLNGTTKIRDVNYSSDIYSPGQTVVYQ